MVPSTDEHLRGRCSAGSRNQIQEVSRASKCHEFRAPLDLSIGFHGPGRCNGYLGDDIWMPLWKVSARYALGIGRTSCQRQSLSCQKCHKINCFTASCWRGGVISSPMEGATEGKVEKDSKGEIEEESSNGAINRQRTSWRVGTISKQEDTAENTNIAALRKFRPPNASSITEIPFRYRRWQYRD